MIAKTLCSRAELSFWNIIIPLMSTSPLFRRVYRKLYLFNRDHRGIAWIPTVIFTFASLGLLTGFMLGRMGTSLW
ncbi:MAG: hypothetical protein PHQ40_14295 [Anaerolineaceae bacterium]|nr:hypothetical protein [Anaerolineaceae bacterium]